MKVELCETPNRWDTFLETVPGGHNSHRWAWKQAVEKRYGHKSYYWIATDGGVTQGVLIESRLFGGFLVSVPFATYGGILASSQEAHCVSTGLKGGQHHRS